MNRARMGVPVAVVALVAGALTAVGWHFAGAAGRRAPLASPSLPDASPSTALAITPAMLSAASSTLPASDGLPADCTPKASGPPGSPYQLGLVGTVSNGVLTAGPATVAHITAKFCGVVTLVNGKKPCGVTGSVDSPLDGQIFGSLSALLTLVPGMQPKVPFVANPGVITGGFACQSSSANGLAVTLNARVSGSTGLFGLSCTIGPLNIPLSGVLTGPLGNATITLKSSNFSVPTVTPSPSCPGGAPASLDSLAGLPIRAGGATATLPATTAIYQPAT